MTFSGWRAGTLYGRREWYADALAMHWCISTRALDRALGKAPRRDCKRPMSGGAYWLVRARAAEALRAKAVALDAWFGLQRAAGVPEWELRE